MAINDKEFGELRSDVKNILVLLEKQNGRVGKLEDRTTKLETWRTFLAGAWFVITTAALALWGKS